MRAMLAPHHSRQMEMDNSHPGRAAAPEPAPEHPFSNECRLAPQRFCRPVPLDRREAGQRGASSRPAPARARPGYRGAVQKRVRHAQSHSGLRDGVRLPHLFASSHSRPITASSTLQDATLLSIALRKSRPGSIAATSMKIASGPNRNVRSSNKRPKYALRIAPAIVEEDGAQSSLPGTNGEPMCGVWPSADANGSCGVTEDECTS